MKIEANNTADYISQLPEERQEPYRKLWNTVKDNMPAGFEEQMQYNMPSFSVPLSKYPAGYHCAENEPLPFVSVANQKNFLALYHMGIYAKKELLDWFVSEYPKHAKRKLDMGKSCIRFKKMDDIPYELIAELMQKMSCDEWIEIYEANIKR